MHKIHKPLKAVLSGETGTRKPIWLMRQAGRYLPEYRKLREKAGSFMALCQNPAWASEVTLQPIRRFDLDGAILFADILLVPFGLGQSLTFKEGEGPHLSPCDMGALRWEATKLDPTFEAITRVKSELSPSITFLGFAGGLWTTACYMLQGRSEAFFPRALEKANQDPASIDVLIEILLEATLDYLKKQIKAGVEVIQLFESHAGLLETEEAFTRWIINPSQKLVSALQKECPQIPIIGFPRGASPAQAERFYKETGITVLGLDQKQNIGQIRASLGREALLQGNLDPELLCSGGKKMEEAAKKISAQGGRAHIFNLGHGVLPQTPLSHVDQLVSLVHQEG